MVSKENKSGSQREGTVGFRFHPTDEELVDHYLDGKNAGYVSVDDAISEIDICDSEPWELPGKSKIKSEGERVYYFFGKLDLKSSKSQKSKRTNQKAIKKRATQSGRWKPTGVDQVIKKNGNRIGIRKTLVFYERNQAKGQKSDWIAYEYHSDRVSPTGVSYVIYKVKFRKGKNASTNASSWEVGETSNPAAFSSQIESQNANHDETLQLAEDQSIKDDLDKQWWKDVINGVDTDSDGDNSLDSADGDNSLAPALNHTDYTPRKPVTGGEYIDISSTDSDSVSETAHHKNANHEETHQLPLADFNIEFGEGDFELESWSDLALEVAALDGTGDNGDNSLAPANGDNSSAPANGIPSSDIYETDRHKRPRVVSEVKFGEGNNATWEVGETNNFPAQSSSQIASQHAHYGTQEPAADQCDFDLSKIEFQKENWGDLFQMCGPDDNHSLTDDGEPDLETMMKKLDEEAELPPADNTQEGFCIQLSPSYSENYCNYSPVKSIAGEYFDSGSSSDSDSESESETTHHKSFEDIASPVDSLGSSEGSNEIAVGSLGHEEVKEAFLEYSAAITDQFSGDTETIASQIKGKDAAEARAMKPGVLQFMILLITAFLLLIAWVFPFS